MVAGRVSKIKIGFTMASKNPSTIAKIIAVKKSSICMPGNIWASMNAFTVVINILSKKSIRIFHTM